MSNESFSRKTVLLLTVGLAAGLGLGIGGTLFLKPKAAPQAPPKVMYQCPMHLQIIVDHQTPCPICGMDLVVMDEHGPAGEGTDTHAAVKIDVERQQLIGLRTEKAVEGVLGGELHATARVAVDERRVRKVSVKVEGFVEKLFVNATGMSVAKGAPLFTLYSPELVSAQREYLLALSTRKALGQGSLAASGSDLLEAARKRLAFWDVPAEALERLESTGEVQRTLTLRSPIGGIVTAKNLVEGARLTPADQPFEITDLSQVWVLADLYETEAMRLRPGLAATFTSPALPGRTFQGRVTFVEPIFDAKTRTVKARLEFPNGKGELKPEMFGDVVLKTPEGKGLTVPLDAVLDSGKNKVVFVALGEGRFEPRNVSVGRTQGERIEIRSGVEAGEDVVTRAAFLVDSESRLKAALAQMK